MAVYFVTGTLGCGKTLCTVGKIRDYLEQGRRVATNLDINLAALTKRDSRVSITRVPDKPKLYDLEALGLGCEESNESKYGLLLLDELGTWFNARNWNDKSRLAVIDWFLHARKKHWDIFFIVQNIDSLDSQLVQALCEHLVVCKRTDRLNIPFVGKTLKVLGFSGTLPKVHVAKVYYGKSQSAMLVDRWWYRAKDLYPAYNTDQIFDDDSCGINTVLPAYYVNNIALIETHQKEITRLSQSAIQVTPAAGLDKRIVIAVVSMLVVFFGYRSYYKIDGFKSMTFAKSAVASPVVKNESPLPVQPKEPIVKPSVSSPVFPVSANAKPLTPVSEEWRISSWVVNVKSGKYIYTVTDTLKHMRFIDASACILDSYKQPSCLVDGEVVTMFTGRKLDKKPNQISKPVLPASTAKNLITSALPNSDTMTVTVKDKDKDEKPKCVIKSVMTDEELKACST